MLPYDWFGSQWYNRRRDAAHGSHASDPVMHARDLKLDRPHIFPRVWEVSRPKSLKIAVWVLLLLCMALGSEIISFFLKHLLWIPTDHPLNTARLVVWLMVGMTGTRDCWLYIENIRRSISATMILMGFMMLLEIILVIRMGRN